MIVRSTLAVLFAVAGLLLGAGCGGNGNAPGGDETSDALYQQAQDLKKQGRFAEALNAFVKEIDRRGESGAPESHIEAGTLYKDWSHNPVEAYHHFSKYLELQPTGPRAVIVKGQRDAARRDILAYLLVPPDGQGALADRNGEIQQLQRQIDELRAENQALRGGSPLPASQFRPAPMIALPEENANTVVAADDTQVTPVTPVPTPVEPATQPVADTPFTRNLAAPRPAPPAGTRPGTAPATSSRTPVTTQPARYTTDRAVSTPTRPTAPQRPGATPAASGRRHTVTAGEKSLWSIARQYYGSVNQARVNALFEANRDVMHSPNDLKAGMVLRIP
jgi:LysM repeat protein